MLDDVIAAGEPQNKITPGKVALRMQRIARVVVVPAALMVLGLIAFAFGGGLRAKLPGRRPADRADQPGRALANWRDEYWAAGPRPAADGQCPVYSGGQPAQRTLDGCRRRRQWPPF